MRRTRQRNGGRSIRIPGDQRPKKGRPLMERTVLSQIHPTCHSSKEASVYTGITIAEYYRDMDMMYPDGRFNIPLGRTMREISSRLEEMPGEEGYRLSCSKIIRILRMGKESKSLRKRRVNYSIIGAVSPQVVTSQSQLHRTPFVSSKYSGS